MLVPSQEFCPECGALVPTRMLAAGEHECSRTLYIAHQVNLFIKDLERIDELFDQELLMRFERFYTFDWTER